MSDNMRLEFKLNSIEANSELWRKIKEHLDWQLKCLRERNDGNMNELDTAYLRGQIKHIKDFLTLESDREAVENDGRE